VDALIMVLLGGVESAIGPLVGALSFTVLQDSLARSTEYWRAVMGAVMLLLVLVFPQGIAGGLHLLWTRLHARMHPRTTATPSSTRNTSPRSHT
jgi:branched-chain amino acid transport system permease protein